MKLDILQIIFVVLISFCLVPRVDSANVIRQKNCGCKGTPKCKEVKGTLTFRKWILHAHNNLRNRLAKGSQKLLGKSYKISNMMAFNYDMELEVAARCWALNCERDYDKSRTHSKGPDVGQNIAIINTALSNEKLFTTTVRDWFKEFDYMKDWGGMALEQELFNYTAKLEANMRNFINLVHGRTYLIGCARAIKTSKPVFLVCNYFPAPAKNLSIFEITDTQKCTKAKKNVRYDALCGKTKFPSFARREGSHMCSGIARKSMTLVLLVIISTIYEIF